MKRLIQMAVRIYPRVWRERYGREFEALLEDSGRSGIGDLFDVMKGAMAMRISKSSWRLVGGCALAGALAMTALWATRPSVYRSSGRVSVTSEATAQMINQAAAEVLSWRAIGDLARQHGGSLKPEDIAPNVRISRQGAEAFEVSFESTDPKLSQALAQEVTERMVKELSQRASLFEAPRMGQRAIGPALAWMAFAGTAGGLMIGALLALIRRGVTAATPSAS